MSGQEKLGQSLRIIWAIAAKDIVGALKDKQTAANIIMIVFLLAIYKWLPALGDSRPYLFVYDAGNSQQVARLENLPQFQSSRHWPADDRSWRELQPRRLWYTAFISPSLAWGMSSRRKMYGSGSQ